MLLDIFLSSLKESLVIISIIFGLMVLVELFVLKYKNKIIRFLNINKFLAYVTSSLFGIIPGCIGTFAMDSLYMTGLIGFGGIIAVMVSTSGDEAFLMWSMAIAGKIPIMTIVFLTLLLFFLGILAGFLADLFIKKKWVSFCKCKIIHHKTNEFKFKHFLKKHIFNHIIKKHIWKIFLWIFAALFIIEISNGFIDANSLFSNNNMWFVLIIALLIGLIPISGPNAFLVVMFSNHMIPLSVLIANSIVQDGHGLLPLLGFSLDNALKIKLFNFIFGLIIGAGLLAIGL